MWNSEEPSQPRKFVPGPPIEGPVKHWRVGAVRNHFLRILPLLTMALAIPDSLILAQTGSVTRIEQDDPAIRYTGTWYTNSSSLHSAGMAALTNEKNAEVTITFNGTGINWVGFSDGYSGIAWVYLDGTYTPLDTYSANSQYQRVLYSVRGLAPGPHNLTIQVPHERGPNTAGSWVWIDRFDVENGGGVPGGVTASSGRSEQNNPAITYAGIWSSESGSLYSGGSASLAINPGSLATVNFTGTGITWLAYGDPWSGIAKVYVNGSLRATVDTYRATAQAQLPVFSIQGLQSGSHTLTIEVTGTSNSLSASSWVWLDAFDVVSDPGGIGGSGGPAINSGGMVNAASLSGQAAAGSIVSLFGSGLGLSPISAAVMPLPTTLGTTTVRVNGIPAPLFYVSPSQINFQLPWELSGQSQVSVSVTVGASSTVPVSLALGGFTPGIFTTRNSGGGQGAVLISGTSSIAAPDGFLPGSHPVDRGGYIAIYCTGLGPVTRQPSSGAGAGSAESLSFTGVQPVVFIGGVSAQVVFSGLAPGFVGLYQVNVLVPPQTVPSSQVPLYLTVGGAVSNTVTIAVR
jgi:uncharacterized protein (TIGR03437 family)